MTEKDLNLLKKELNFINEDEIKKEFNRYNEDLIDTIYYVSKKHNKKISEKFKCLSEKAGRIQDEDGNLFEENLIKKFIEESEKLKTCFFPKEQEQTIKNLTEKIPLLEKIIDGMLEKNSKKTDIGNIDIIEEMAYISPEILEQHIEPLKSFSYMEDVD